MKKRFVFFTAILLAVSGAGFSQNLSVVLDSTINYTAGAGEAANHSVGFEQFANFRLHLRGERTTLITALNFIAITGNYLEAASLFASGNPHPYLAFTPIIHGQNYAAGMELERLYFRVHGDHFDFETGLRRMPFGFGQVWGSSDFLNPRNPLAHNARPRGVLGADLTFYPTHTMMLMLFAAAPRDPFVSDGGGFVPGISFEQHWSRASLQALYAFQTPHELSGPGLHRFGLSARADLELGFILDALYTLNPNNGGGIQGLSFGFGFDYSFFGGDLYILAEYLFNGSASASALGFGGYWTNHHYLFASATYRFNDFSSAALAAVFSFDDMSFSPILTVAYDLFQGFTLNLTARVPLDREVLTGGRPGELGPVNSGARFILNAGARLRF